MITKKYIGFTASIVLICLLFGTATATPEIAGQRTFSGTTFEPGDTFTVTIDIDITDTVYGLVLDEDVPSGWAVTEVSNDNAIYNELDISWLWSGSTSTCKTLIYEITILNEATEGDYYFTGTVLATINSKTIERTITGDDLVTIKGTNWRDEWFGDTSEEGLTITTSELQDAIHHWLDDEPVRGYTLTTPDLQEVISAWLLG